MYYHACVDIIFLFLLCTCTIQRTFPVARVYQGGTKINNASSIKAKKGDSDCRVFLVVDRENKPLLHFSTKLFESPTKKDGKTVRLILETRHRTPISLGFNDSDDADYFHKFVSGSYESGETESESSSDD